MPKFLDGNDLNAEIGKIFKNAEQQLILISPYIKLHHRYSDELKSKINNDKLSITIVFGKNENDLRKSLSVEDFNFFKQFPNIEIFYEKRLHAKFYANEKTQVITSMNLYNYSQDQNIEVGIKTDYGSIFGNLAGKLVTGETAVDIEAWDYFLKVIGNSELLFRNEPQYESTMFGLNKKYTGFKTVVDKFSGLSSPSQLESKIEGFCIRTGERIPFNVQRPYSEKAYKSWAQFKNLNYKEKFCHKTGMPSNGNTSMANPIL